jgi:superfamily II DNA or RNA helicase
MTNIKNIQRIAELEAIVKRLLAENATLRGKLELGATDIASSDSNSNKSDEESSPLNKTALKEFSTNQKIELFRSLFKGREDVFPIRWESKNGRTGYSPVCENEWLPRICEKPRVKCADCINRKFVNIKNEDIFDHLSGKKTIGAYALLEDETCWFLAADFDGDHAKSDALAFANTAKLNGIDASIEISRSGNGAHVWIFFERALPAVTARRLGTALITLTCDNERLLSLESYDRLFPNQDTMPKGGFGNLIALPLQKIPRESGFSVFVDQRLMPYPNQWDYLSNVKKVSYQTAERVIQAVNLEGGVLGVKFVSVEEDIEDPWIMPPSRRLDEKPIRGPFPEEIEIVFANMVFIPKAELPTGLLNRLVRVAAFQNPEFYKTQKMRLSTFDIPRIIGCAEEFENFLALPRGCIDEAKVLLESQTIKVTVRDERFFGEKLEVRFLGELRPDQSIAVKTMIKSDAGVLCAPTAFGKTVSAAAIIAERKVNTLILVHRTQLMDQWASRLSSFLNIEEKQIGKISGGKRKVTNLIDIALMQSLNKQGVVDDVIANYGQIIVDECHHLSAFSFEQILKAAKARYVLGLTATPIRRDGHHPIIFMQCGGIKHRAKDQHQNRPFLHEVITINTGFKLPDEAEAIYEIYAHITNSASRNQKIVDDIRAALSEGRSPLVLTERKDHLFMLESQLQDVSDNLITLYGGMGAKKRRQQMDKLSNLPSGASRVILATGKLIGEGFDDPQLDTLFLSMPISWQGTLKQYAGRLHRLNDGKKLVQVYDYVDESIPVLMRMYEKRKKGYKVMGYSLRENVGFQNLI